jgi:hypothetical protein
LPEEIKTSYALQYANAHGFGFTAATSVIGGKTVELAMRWRGGSGSVEPLTVYTMSYDAAQKLIEILTAALDEIDAKEEATLFEETKSD